MRMQGVTQGEKAHDPTLSYVRRSSYTRLDEQGLAQAQVQTIERVAKELSLDISTAGIMLVHEGWDENIVVRRYRLEGLFFAQACGVTPKEVS